MTSRLTTSDTNADGAGKPEPIAHLPGDLRRALKATALVFVVGPPAGSLVLSAMAAYSGITDSITRTSIINDLPQAITGWIMLSAFLALFSYVYGALPVALSCLLLGWRIYRHGTVSMTESICMAVVAGVIAAIVVAAVSGDSIKGLTGLLVLFVPCAILSAFICRRLLSTFGILPLPSAQKSI